MIPRCQFCNFWYQSIAWTFFNRITSNLVYKKVYPIRLSMIDSLISLPTRRCMMAKARYIEKKIFVCRRQLAKKMLTSLQTIQHFQFPHCPGRISPLIMHKYLLTEITKKNFHWRRIFILDGVQQFDRPTRAFGGDVISWHWALALFRSLHFGTA